MRSRHIDFLLIGLVAMLLALAVWYSAAGGEKISSILFSILLAFPLIIVCAVLLDWWRYTRRSPFPPLLCGFVSLAILASIAIFQWPLRITCALSHDVFDSLARRVRAGENLPCPLRVGLLTIRKVEIYHDASDLNDYTAGIVCLWTHSDSGGNTGFVQCSRDLIPFNLWSAVKLDGGWQFISED